MSDLNEEFERYFHAMDQSGGHDRCYVCRRTPAEVKSFFGFDEDGVPTHAGEYGLEDVVLEKTDIMSYRGLRPVCAVCQLNVDMIAMLGEEKLMTAVLNQMRDERSDLWPAQSKDEPTGGATDETEEGSAGPSTDDPAE